MRRVFFMIGLVIAGLFCELSFAHSRSFDKGPYLQNVSQDSVVILWQSRAFKVGKVTIHSSPPQTIESNASSSVHELRVTGLEPGRRYSYTVNSGGEDRTGEFATAPASYSPFSFVVFGDSRSNAHAHARVVERIRRDVPDLLLGTGDVVNDGGSEDDWNRFFQIEGALLQESILFPSIGNHDRQGGRRAISNYRKYFSLPENSPDPERYYSFTYGCARFIMLDSNAYSFALTDQTVWLEKQMQSARQQDDIKHIFVTMHHPPYSVSLHGGHRKLREVWTPLFEKYEIDAVFSGHDHVYSRAYKNGVNYFVSGGGGAPLYPRKARASRVDIEATQFFEQVNHHLRVHVIGDNVEVTAVRADGTLMESLSWRRGSGDTEELKMAGEQVRDSSVAPVTGGTNSVAPVTGGTNRPVSSSSIPPSAKKLASRGIERRGFGFLGAWGSLMMFGAGVVGYRAWRR